MLRPLRSNVLLKLQAAEESRPSGLIIKSSSDNLAVVIAIGAEVKELKQGDVVRFDKQGAVPVEGYLMTREADVLCIVE